MHPSLQQGIPSRDYLGKVHGELILFFALRILLTIIISSMFPCFIVDQCASLDNKSFLHLLLPCTLGRCSLILSFFFLVPIYILYLKYFCKCLICGFQLVLQNICSRGILKKGAHCSIGLGNAAHYMPLRQGIDGPQVAQFLSCGQILQNSRREKS